MALIDCVCVSVWHQDERYFDNWQVRFREAELDMTGKEERTEALVDELEQRLTLLGASGELRAVFRSRRVLFLT